MMLKRLLLLLILIAGFNATAQTLGFDIDYKTPVEYEVGPIRIEGADNYDHQAIKLIAGIRQGQSIFIPGEAISKAIKNLWAEGLFSDVEIFAEKEGRLG